MPRGSYHHHRTEDSLALIERFSCAPGPSGWRYVSELSTAQGRGLGSIDLTLDSWGRQLRVAVSSRGWTMRGGRSGADLLWVRRPERGTGEAEEHHEQAAGFTFVSPGFLIAAAALLGAGGAPRRLRLVLLSDTLGGRRCDEQWRVTGRSTHAADLGSLDVTAYGRVDLDTGTASAVHLAGDVVLSAPGIDLAELDSAPSTALPWPST